MSDPVYRQLRAIFDATGPFVERPEWLDALHAPCRSVQCFGDPPDEASLELRLRALAGNIQISGLEIERMCYGRVPHEEGTIWACFVQLKPAEVQKAA